MMAHPIMVMGIMASGKSRVGARIAEQQGGQFIECDDWHPDSNVAKMRSGIPLTDEDRWPWLDRLAKEVVQAGADGKRVVFSCSALKKTYRARLRKTIPNLTTVCLILDAETATARASGRDDHFMPAALVESQLATLEVPDGSEPRTILVDATGAFENVLEQVERALENM